MRTALLLALALGAAPAEPALAPAPGGAGPPVAGAGAPRSCAPELFRIARSTNANEVVYAARLARGGGLDKEDPLSAEWHMLAEDGHREGLNFLENMMAYGFSVDPAPEGEGYRVVLKAKKDRPVHLKMHNGCPTALVRIAGRPAILRRIFVQAGAGGVIPTVAFADIEGEDPENGDSLFERVYPR